MALRAVPDHPKFADLKAILKQPKGSTIGWLETMWHFTGRFTPQGNIGKYTDAQIEAWLEWNGIPGELMAAFIKAKWIDVDPVHRLLVHDWPQHADKATKNALNRSHQTFCTPGVRTEIPKVAEIDHPSRLPEPEPEPEPVPEPEAKTKTTPRSAATFVPPEWVPLESWQAFGEMRKKIRAPLTFRACELTVIDLDKLRKDGHDPGPVLMQSVQRCWRGVFELKSENGNKSRTKAAMDEIRRRSEEEIDD